MNPYVCETICGVCGGGGISTPSDSAAEWRGVSLVHSDPNICRDVLKKQKDDLDKRSNIRKSEDAAALEDRKFVLDEDDEYMYEQLEAEDSIEH